MMNEKQNNNKNNWIFKIKLKKVAVCSWNFEYKKGRKMHERC